MRRFVIALLVLIPAVAFAANPTVLETRSQQHLLSVEQIPDTQPAEYAVRVTNIASGELLVSPRLVLRSGAAQSLTEVHDLRVRVTLARIDGGIAATLEVERGEVLLDSIESRWRFVPGRARMHAPGALRVGGDVKAPMLVHRVEPQYNEEARQARISGIVIIEALIDKTGAVKNINVLKGLPNGLSEAAASAVRQWTFAPATLDGQPVDVVFNVTVNFKLDGKPRREPQ